MKTYEVAGHEFPDTVDAVCQRTLPNGQQCCRTWAEIEHTTREQVNDDGIAHISQLTLGEFDEIQAEKKRRAEQRERAWAAIADICG